MTLGIIIDVVGLTAAVMAIVGVPGLLFWLRPRREKGNKKREDGEAATKIVTVNNVEKIENVKEMNIRL